MRSIVQVAAARSQDTVVVADTQVSKPLPRLQAVANPVPPMPARLTTYSRRVALDLVGFADVAAVLFGGLLAAALYTHFGELAINWLRVLQAGLVTALFAYFCLRHFGFYDERRIHDLPCSPARVLMALVIAFAALPGLGAPFGMTNADFWVWHATWASASGAVLIANHAAARRNLGAMTRAGRFDTRVALYGVGAVAERIASAIADPRLGISLVGIYDDRALRRGSGAGALAAAGGLDDLIAAGRAGRIDQIIIALPEAHDARATDIARRLEQLPVSLHIYTHIASDLVGDGVAHSVSSLGPIGLVDLKAKPLSDWSPIVKTWEDYLVGSVALILALPVMAGIALAIKLTSRGPVLFRQRRHGLNRRVIEVAKFRTMRVMEDGGEVRQAERGDPRVTRLGAFLRSTSLDELPQLFNVLRGEMSLVGPRPHALVHDDHYGEMLERYANRHQVKPGMTGLAQVNGFRGPTESTDKMASRVEQDLAYIDTWSLWLDIEIMALTIVRGFRHKNAL